MTDTDKGKAQGNLLSLPYRDRQLVAVMPQRESESTIERLEIPLSAYFVGNSLNPLSVFTKDYWVDYPKRMNFRDTKNWGIIGYAIDKVKIVILTKRVIADLYLQVQFETEATEK